MSGFKGFIVILSALFTYQNLAFTRPALSTPDHSTMETVGGGQIRFGNPTYLGLGCPDGSVQPELSPNQTELTLYYGSFHLEVGEGTNRIFDNRECLVLIPVSVDPGVSLSIFSTQVLGHNMLSWGTLSHVRLDYRYTPDGGAPVDGQASIQDFQGPLDSDFVLSGDSSFQTGGRSAGLLELKITAILDSLRNHSTMDVYTSDTFGSPGMMRIRALTAQ